MKSDNIKKGIQRAPHRSLLRACGLGDNDFDKPFIGIANSFTEIVPGHIHLRELVEFVKEGIIAAGGIPFEFNTMAICDGISMNHEGMKYSLPSREIIAATVESMAKGHSFDGLVLMPSCDKVVPGMLMGAARVDVPTIVVTGGPMAAGQYKGKNADLITVFEAVGQESAGKISEEEVFYAKALRESSSENISERDNGLACLVVLWNNKPLEKYRDSIENVFWKNDKDTLPITELYYSFIWERLPHPESVDFSKLYYTYLMNTEYVESVTSTGRTINNSYGSVRDYFSFFYSTSGICQRECNKVILNKELANTILTRSYEFIIHEKSLVKYDFMGEKDECESKFLVIGELVALVYCEAIENQLITEIYPLIEKIKKALSDCQINTIAIDILEMTEENKFEECVDMFENIILAKDKKLYSSVFTGIQCLVFVKENSNQNISFEKFFSSIKYLDIEYSKTLWLHLTSLLRQPFFAKEKVQRYITLSISKCIDIYEKLANQGERYYLDGLYNCVEALHQYYKNVKTSGDDETDELKQCVEKAMKIKNYEIANIWSC